MAELRRALAGVDVVVNAVGIFRPTGQQSFDALHVKAPLALLAAARDAGVRRFVQVSALGANASSPLPYFASKGLADAAMLAAGGIEVSIVRPSLVFAPDGRSTCWFARLAALPLTPLPGDGGQEVQPLHLDDLVQALVALVETSRVPALLQAVGPRALSFRDYLAMFKRHLRAGGMFVPVPVAWMQRLARVASRWVDTPLDADALAMLERGNTADPSAIAEWLGHAPRDPEQFLTTHDAANVRNATGLAWLLPLMRGSLAALWIVTAIVSLWVYPREQSLAMLERTGLHGMLAHVALWAAAGLDFVVGVSLLLLRHRGAVYAAQLLLVAGYTVIISVALPEQWAHPFAPVLKNLPLMAMIAALWALDRGHGPGLR